jgi:hypothetical protein
MIMMRARDTHAPFGGLPLIGHKELYVSDPHDVIM